MPGVGQRTVCYPKFASMVGGGLIIGRLSIKRVRAVDETGPSFHLSQMKKLSQRLQAKRWHISTYEAEGFVSMYSSTPHFDVFQDNRPFRVVLVPGRTAQRATRPRRAL